MKPWYKSKTVWFNIITVGGAIAAAGVGLLPTLAPLLSPNVFAIVTVTVGVVNIALRSMTSDAIWFMDNDK